MWFSIIIHVISLLFFSLFLARSLAWLSSCWRLVSWIVRMCFATLYLNAVVLFCVSYCLSFLADFGKQQMMLYSRHPSKYTCWKTAVVCVFLFNAIRSFRFCFLAEPNDFLGVSMGGWIVFASEWIYDFPQIVFMHTQNKNNKSTTTINIEKLNPKLRKVGELDAKTGTTTSKRTFAESSSKQKESGYEYVCLSECAKSHCIDYENITITSICFFSFNLRCVLFFFIL